MTPISFHSSIPTRKEFDQLAEEVKKLRRRVQHLERGGSSLPKDASSAQVGGASSAQVGASALLLKEFHHESEGTCSESSSPTATELADLIRHVDKLYACTRILLLQLFPREYIVSHSVSGKPSNSKTQAKPIFDQRLYGRMITTLKEKFPSVQYSEITAKVHAVQKSLKVA